MSNDKRYGLKGRTPYNKPAPKREEPAIQDENIISGRNAVRELLEGGRDIEKIYVQKGEREGSLNQIIAIARERNIIIKEAERTRLDELSLGGRHQGVVAIAAERNYFTPEDILSYAEERGERPFVIILDGVEDSSLSATRSPTRIISARSSGAPNVRERTALSYRSVAR